MNRPRGWVCPRNRRSSEIPAQFLHQRADSRNLKCKRKLSSGRVWCAHRYRRIPAQQSSTLRQLVAEWVFSTFPTSTFFRKSALEGDSDRLLDSALLKGYITIQYQRIFFYKKNTLDFFMKIAKKLLRSRDHSREASGGTDPRQCGPQPRIDG